MSFKFTVGNFRGCLGGKNLVSFWLKIWPILAHFWAKKTLRVNVYLGVRFFGIGRPPNMSGLNEIWHFLGVKMRVEIRGLESSKWPFFAIFGDFSRFWSIFGQNLGVPICVLEMPIFGTWELKSRFFGVSQDFEVRARSGMWAMSWLDVTWSDWSQSSGRVVLTDHKVGCVMSWSWRSQSCGCMSWSWLITKLGASCRGLDDPKVHEAWSWLITKFEWARGKRRVKIFQEHKFRVRVQINF